MTDDFFRNRLDKVIDWRHALAVLANRMPWQERREVYLVIRRKGNPLQLDGVFWVA